MLARVSGGERRWWLGLVLAALLWASMAEAELNVAVTGPSGNFKQSLPDSGGVFDVSLPLNKNSVNKVKVTASDAKGNSSEQEIAITQVSLESVVISEFTSTPLSPERVEQLVNSGVIQLDNPENFNVSQFSVVLTIGTQQVPISVPIAMPINGSMGYETYKLPRGDGSGGNPTPEIQVVVFEEYPPAPPGLPPPPSIPGVIIIEGRIKSLKEFFSCRLLLMNASGIFTLSNVSASLSFPDGGLSNVLPADGIASFGDILPGDGGKPGQIEKEFIIRGDEIGVRKVRVNFGGTVTGPGIPADQAIPFNGSAVTDVEVKGPPTFLVQLIHPDYVTDNEPYELKVDITNTGETPALYASLDLDVGADADLVEGKTDPVTGEVTYEQVTGTVTRSLGHIFPGQSISQTYTIIPFKTGPITSCMGLADQNITLQVIAGIGGCITGTYPPRRGVPDGVPTVAVLPPANAMGIGIDAPVVALFSEMMSGPSITTGENGTFNVTDSDGNRVPGQLRFAEISGRMAAIWQVNDGITNRLKPDAEYTVFISGAMDLQGQELYSPWQSTFSTTGMALNDHTPPELTLMILPPVRADYVMPGQVVRVNAYGTDQGSGVVRVECRIKDLDDPEGKYTLVDMKSVLSEDKPPYIFSIDSSALNFGHSYEIMGTAYDYMGNTRNTTMGMWIADSADPPTLVLPDDPAGVVLHGISIPLTPTRITGGVREIQFFLDGAAEAFNTSTLSPYQVRLDTLGLTLGTHTVRAVAVDGLNQTGEDTLTFELAENKNMPTVSFGVLQDGMQVLVGQPLIVNASAEDPVGIVSVAYYLDGTKAVPIATGTEPFSIDTGALSLGTHSLFIVATNKLGVTNDIADPASVLEFAVVQPPPGQPPAAPSLTSVSYPVDGKVTVVGQSVANAKIEITNTTLGLTVTTQANGGGTFTGVVGAAAGDVLRVVAYDLSQSPDPSQPTQTVVQAAPILQRIEVSPTSHTFTNFTGYVDLQVTGYYDNSTTANLTSKATFSSSATGVAGVTASGRTAPIANGTATITATVEGMTAASEITVHVVVLTRIGVTPSPVELAAIDQAVTLTVTAYYSDDSTAPAQGPLSFVSADTRIATVNSSGVVRAAAPGNTQITVYQPGADPVQVPVVVNTGADPIPTVTILSPATNTLVERGQTVLVRVRAEDTLGGVTQIALNATGAVVASDLRTISPASLSTEQTLFFNVPNTATLGGTITVRVTATDTSGAPSIAATLLLPVGDKTAPAARITAPASQAEFAPGEAVTVTVAATDVVGVTQIRYATIGSIVQSGTRNISPASADTSVSFTFVVPSGVVDPEVRIQAFARDAAGNEGAAAPVDILIQSVDRTPPSTEATAVSTPSGATATVSYRVTDGLSDLDHVELFFRKDGIGAFNRYTRADAGNAQGRYTPQSGATGTIVFDSTRMGGDGHYEFYTAGVDTTGNREAAPTDGAKALLPDQQVDIAAGTVWTDLTTNTIVGDGDTSYDGQNLRITNATLTLSGHHAFKNLELLGGAVLTHPETDETTEYGLDFEAWTVLIDSTSGINVTGRGYPGGRSGHDPGWTLAFAEGASFRSGASYGGFGAGIEGTPNPVYGNLIMPVDLGSGGSRGYYGERGGDGGGRISIAAVNLMVDGTVQADGGTGLGSGAGDGSGGSVYLALSTLSGAGPVRANGGSRELPGGGGRVAVHYTDLSTLDTARITALGGSAGGRTSGNGTVFLHDMSQTGGDLVIDGQPGVESTFTTLPIPPGYVFDNIVLRNNARVRVDGEFAVNDTLSLLTGSVLTHSQGNEAGLNVTAKRLYVDDTSAFDVTGKGYAGGKSAGNYENEGLTLGGLLGARFRSAGSYGGIGNTVDGPGPNPVYGTSENPIYLGSGGSRGYYGEVGGNGGGRITVNASQSVEVDGALRANGGTGGGSNAGDGSGGSILIRTALFKGMGRVSADGGSYESCGGGGRVAVFYTYTGIPGNDFDGLRDVTAFGGQRGAETNRAGSAGTVFFKRSDQARGDAYVDAGREATTRLCTPLTPVGFGRIIGLSADTITTDGGVAYTPNGLVGLEVNPNLNQTQTYRVTSNTLTTITLDTTSKPALTSVAALGDQFSAIYRYDNFTVRGGAYLAFDDQIVVTDTLLIDENARVTHLDADPSRPIPRLDLTAGTLRVAETGWLEADGRGYPGGFVSHDPGFTAGYADGSTFRSAGSHGGLGARQEGTPTVVYDSLTDPADYGSGGSRGWYGEHGGDGGGRIVIRAGTLEVDGLLTANGVVGGGSSAGSGAGGAVNLSVDILTGVGHVRANGGAFEVGGGGGRIAVRYTSLEMDTALFEVLGGQGSSNRIGGIGTLYLKGPGQQYGDLVIDGFGVNTPQGSTGFPGGYTFDNVMLRNKAQVLCDQNVQVLGALRLQSGSVLTHSLNSENGLRITAESIEVDADSSIDVSRKGYPGGRVLVNTDEGYTIGGVPGARVRSGGSYGGVGGWRDGGGGPNSVYGIPSKPIYLGSGGSRGWYGELGGNGGGLVWLTAGSVTIDGSILANGGTGGGSEAGSGSGGSVWIKAATVSGAGNIQANGGAYQVGGGGGRICIEYATLGGSGHDFDGLRSVTAFGGIVSSANNNASAGTVLMKRTGQSLGDLYLDAGVDAATATHASRLTPVGYGRVQEVNGDTVTVETNVEYWPNSLAGVEFSPNLNQDVTYTILSNTSSTITLVTAGKPALSTITQAGDEYAAMYRFDNVYFRRGAYLSMADPLRVSGTLDLRELARLTHFDVNTTFEPRLDVHAADLFVSADSIIEADGRGYVGGRHGHGLNEGYTLGNLLGANARSGASYGGLGGVYDGAGTNPVYGNPLDPAAHGSGGSMGYYGEWGGDGGGRILLRAQNAVIDGRVSADGLSGNGSGAGGGSGGTVRIEAGDVRGAGLIHANGGWSEPGGGGGRILITYDTFGGAGDDFNGTLDITATGGKHWPTRAGSAGTVVLRQNDQELGNLILDDGMTGATAPNWTPFQFAGFGTVTDLTADTLTTSGQVRMIPNGLVGIEINPNLAQNETYRITGNTATTITVDLEGKPALTSIVSIGSPYAGVMRFDNVQFRKGGFLVMGDLLRVNGAIDITDYGVLTHWDATATYEPRLDVWAGSLSVDATSQINVNGRGYLGGRHGHGNNEGYTLGNVLGATFRSAGSYGGLGARQEGTPNPVYGDQFNPAALGSGGSMGWYGQAGGDGGGWAFLWAGSMAIDGIVSANGAVGGGDRAGSGSGGSVNIMTPSLTGAGQITSGGGAGELGGGGGRVALRFNPATSNTAGLTITAPGGTGSSSSGAAGTTALIPGGVASPY